MWGDISHQIFCEEINSICNEVVHFRINIFNLPSGEAGKHFIEELTFWLKQCCKNKNQKLITREFSFFVNNSSRNNRK